jgi:hypothetical protein
MQVNQSGDKDTDLRGLGKSQSVRDAAVGIASRSQIVV